MFSRDEGVERGLLESLKIDWCHIGSEKTFSPFKLPHIKVCRPGRKVEVILLHLSPIRTEHEQCTSDYIIASLTSHHFSSDWLEKVSSPICWDVVLLCPSENCSKLRINVQVMSQPTCTLGHLQRLFSSGFPKGVFQRPEYRRGWKGDRQHEGALLQPPPR